MKDLIKSFFFCIARKVLSAPESNQGGKGRRRKE
jgi:hypothetical protein